MKDKPKTFMVPGLFIINLEKFVIATIDGGDLYIYMDGEDNEYLITADGLKKARWEAKDVVEELQKAIDNYE